MACYPDLQSPPLPHGGAKLKDNSPLETELPAKQGALIKRVLAP